MTATLTYGDTDLLRLFLNRDNWERYNGYIKESALLPESWEILSAVGEEFKRSPTLKEVDLSTLRTSFLLKKSVRCKADKMDAYKSLFDALAAAPTGDPSKLLEFFISLDYASKFASTADGYVQAGGASATDLSDNIRELLAAYDMEIALLGTGKSATASLEVSDDISDIVNKVFRGKGGLEWRLEDLNLSVGPVFPGDLIVVGARPNVGKTRFMVSELTYWMKQLDRDATAIIFNNEEDGLGIKGAVLCAALNRDMSAISTDMAKAKDDFEKAVGWGRIKVIDRAYMTTTFCEKLIRAHKPKVVVFNQLYKIMGAQRRDATDTENMRRTYQWAREVAKELDCVCISAHQADVRGEGERILTQDMLYGTKTGVQGEVDLCLMIGKTHDPMEQDMRTINIARNKLPGGPRTNPSLRESSFQCRFDGARSRYESLLITKTIGT